MKILSLDTSTKAGSVAILEDDTIIGEVYFSLEKTHSERILPIIDYVLNFTNIDLNEIDFFVSGIGPGSFTGIRIGLSIIKAFSFVFKKPIIGINSFQAIKSKFHFKNFIIIIPARKTEFFYAIIKEGQIHSYSTTKDEFPSNIDTAVILKNSIFKGIQNFSNRFKNFKKIYFTELFAHDFGKVAINDINAKKITYDVNPFYMKLSDAEEKLIKT